MKKIDLGNISIGGGNIEESCTPPVVTPPESCGCDHNNDGCGCSCGCDCSCDNSCDSSSGIDIGGGSGSGNNGGCGCGCNGSAFDSSDGSSSNEKDVYFRGCEDAKTCNMGDFPLEYQGCILDISMCLKNVCPGKRVAVGIALYEVDSLNVEYSRGIKMFTVPAHSGSCCADIPICDIRFILPEDISVGSGEGCSSRRHFIVRVDAQYLDGNVPCSCSCSSAN